MTRTIDTGSGSGAGRPLVRRVGLGVAGALAASAAIVVGTITVAAAPAPAQASAESYIIGGTVTALTSTAVAVGPLQPAGAYVPGSAGSTQTSLVSCGAPAAACLDPVIVNAQALLDTAKATLTSSTTTDCAPGVTLPAGFFTGTLTGANGCSTTAGLGALAGPLAPLNLNVGALQVQSLTQSCTTTPVGRTSIASLSIGAITVPSSVLLNPAPNFSLNSVAVVGPALTALGITVILNEQHYDASGHGLTVNAIHIIVTGTLAPVASADLVVGHTHSQAVCDTGTTDTGGNNPPRLPRGTKADGSATVAAGGTQHYTLSVSHGTPPCTLTSVTDTLPPGFTYVVGSLSGSNFGIAPTVGTAPVTGQQTLTFANAAGLPAANPLTASFDATVSASLPAGQYVNNATIMSSCGEVHVSDAGTRVTNTTTTGPGPNGPTGPTVPPTGPPVPPTGAGMAGSLSLLLITTGLGLSATGLGLRRQRGPAQNIDPR